MKKRISMLLACAMMLALVSCGGNGNGGNTSNPGNQSNVGGGSNTSANQSNSSAGGSDAAEYHIGIITGSVRSEEHTSELQSQR